MKIFCLIWKIYFSSFDSIDIILDGAGGGGETFVPSFMGNGYDSNTYIMKSFSQVFPTADYCPFTKPTLILGQMSSFNPSGTKLGLHIPSELRKQNCLLLHPILDNTRKRKASFQAHTSGIWYQFLLIVQESSE